MDKTFPREKLQSMLIEAIEKCDFSLVKKLLDAGADVNDRAQDFRGILTRAARYSTVKIIKLLLDRGADIANYILIDAVERCNFSLVEKSLDAGADVNGCPLLGMLLFLVRLLDTLQQKL